MSMTFFCTSKKLYIDFLVKFNPTIKFDWKIELIMLVIKF
jgi:hypothetical protein